MSALIDSFALRVLGMTVEWPREKSKRIARRRRRNEMAAESRRRNRGRK